MLLKNLEKFINTKPVLLLYFSIKIPLKRQYKSKLVFEGFLYLKDNCPDRNKHFGRNKLTVDEIDSE